MNRYVIEHKSVVEGVREQPVIEMVEEIYAANLKEALEIAKRKYTTTDENEYVCVRPVGARTGAPVFKPVPCQWRAA